MPGPSVSSSPPKVQLIFSVQNDPKVTELTAFTNRERLESRDLLAPAVSVDLLDPWDPLDWLVPLVSPDVRYGKISV